MRAEIWTDGGGRAWRVWVPQTRRQRARGLLGRAGLEPTEGLFLSRCRSIHTFGMRFAIDAVLLDGRMQVVHVVRMPPGRVLLPKRGCRHVLEIAAGSQRRAGERFSRSISASAD